VRLSPDEGRIAFTQQEAHHYNLWVGDLANGTKARIGDTGADYQSPVWTPDSRFVKQYRYSAHSRVKKPIA
jgi:Tol biopolymer transport system component